MIQIMDSVAGAAVMLADEFQHSMLVEVVNIGVGHATTALHQLTNHTLHMTVPRVTPNPLNRVRTFINTPLQPVFAGVMSVGGDIKATIATLFPWSSAQEICYCLLGNYPTSIEAATELEISTLLEVSNIMISASLAVISDVSDFSLHTTSMVGTFEWTEAVFSTLLANTECGNNGLLLIDAEIYSPTRKINTFMLYLFSIKSVELLLKKLSNR
jgi:chemotaxis protein CheC